MDTVWTTVKVRRSVLTEAAEMLPGMSNAAIVQRALETVLGSAPDNKSGSASAPSRVPVEETGGGSGARTASDRSAPLARDPAMIEMYPQRKPGESVKVQIEGQTTVDEMLASCPNCAETLRPADNGHVLACSECGYVREPS